MKIKLKVVCDNWLCFFWFLFYFILYRHISIYIPSLGFRITLVPLYLLSFLIALSPLAEKLWRAVLGIRPLRLKSERERLLPLFIDVSSEALATDVEFDNSVINLYIQESMDINAFAFGRSTLVLTRGSVQLLSDEALSGLIAHELGHFAHRDTTMALFMSVSNFPMSCLMALFHRLENKLENSKVNPVLKWIFNFIHLVFKSIEFISDLILMHDSRKHEYRADMFAYKCGYGDNLATLLNQVYETSFGNSGNIIEQLKSTHPHITKRIEKLETAQS